MPRESDSDRGTKLPVRSPDAMRSAMAAIPCSASLICAKDRASMPSSSLPRTRISCPRFPFAISAAALVSSATGLVIDRERKNAIRMPRTMRMPDAMMMLFLRAKLGASTSLTSWPSRSVQGRPGKLR